MKSDRLLHPELLSLVARAGHGDLIVLADAGLRLPTDRHVIHVGVTAGVPTIEAVMQAVAAELVIEAAEVATEFEQWNPEVYRRVLDALPVRPTARPHAELMDDAARRALAYVKTGECTAFASVALTCGVSYFDEAVALYQRLHGRLP